MIRNENLPEGNLKESSGFSICALSFQGLQGSLTCIFIRGGQEGEGGGKKKKSFARDPAGCLKLLFGDLNFSCPPNEFALSVRD